MSSNKTTKKQTCQFWAKGKCEQRDADCTHAHYFFPLLRWRTNEYGYKEKICGQKEKCWYPEDVCGLSHLAVEDFEKEKQRNTNIVRGRLNEYRPWNTAIQMSCKGDACRFTTSDIHAIVEHTRTCDILATQRSRSPEKSAKVEGRMGPQDSHKTASPSTHVRERSTDSMIDRPKALLSSLPLKDKTTKSDPNSVEFTTRQDKPVAGKGRTKSKKKENTASAKARSASKQKEDDAEEGQVDDKEFMARMNKIWRG